MGPCPTLNGEKTMEAKEKSKKNRRGSEKRRTIEPRNHQKILGYYIEHFIETTKKGVLEF